MSELLPIIEQLANCKTHAERAAWLRSCPIAYLRQYDSTIRNRLMLAGFPAGVAYLDDMRLHMCATRDPQTGMFTADTQEVISTLGQVIDILAIRFDRDAAHRAEVADHSITEL